ncbi:hypothetical protein E4K72_06910, partial [Oxalobacteraceae bacterium OM1]
METRSPQFRFGAGLAALGLIAAAQVHAADAPEPKPKDAKQRALEQRLAKADAQAAALQQRIDALEKKVQSLSAALATNGNGA